MKKIVVTLIFVLWAQVAHAGYVFYDTSTGVITGSVNETLTWAQSYVADHPSEAYLEATPIPNRNVWRVDITAQPILRLWTDQELSDKEAADTATQAAKTARKAQVKAIPSGPVMNALAMDAAIKLIIQVMEDKGDL